MMNRKESEVAVAVDEEDKNVAMAEPNDLMMMMMALGEGSNHKKWKAKVVIVNSNEDILEKLLPHAATNEIFILGAIGDVSYIELLNPPEAPVAKTSLQGHFEISSIEGNIVVPKKHDKNPKCMVTVLVASNDGQIRGGPVRSLIAKSRVQVTVSTINKYAIQSRVCKEHWTGNEIPILVEQSKRMSQVVDKVYKATLKELNQTITHS